MTLQLDLFQPVPEDFWDGGTLPVPSDIQRVRLDRAITAAEAVFAARDHNRNHSAYRLLVRLRKQRAALQANDNGAVR